MWKPAHLFAQVLFLGALLAARGPAQQPGPEPPARLQVVQEVELKVSGEDPLRRLFDANSAMFQFRLTLTEARRVVQPQIVHLRIQSRPSAAGGLPSMVTASGLLLDSRGLVVTPAKLLEHAERIGVRLLTESQGRSRRGMVVGIDAQTGLGLLSVGPVSDAPLDGRFAEPVEGSIVLSVATSDVDLPTTALGMLYGRVQNFVVDDNVFQEILQVTLQTDPGNPGGVLAQADGRIVGLMLPTPDGAAEAPEGGRVSIALPARHVQEALARLLDRFENPAAPTSTAPGRVWIGLNCRDAGELIQEHLRLSGGVVVESVYDDSPALRAGIGRNDIVVGWGDQSITGIDQFHELLSASAAGDQIVLQVIQKGVLHGLPVTLGTW